MIETFTQNDVIRYVYDEVSSIEKEAIRQAILSDSEMQEFYDDMAEIKGAIVKLKKEPSDRAIRNILNYSKAYYLRSA